MREEPSAFPGLFCPHHRRQLEHHGGGLALNCPDGHVYSVENGIPRFVADDANYAEAFGRQWHHYRLTQLDSYTKTNLSRDRLYRCLGEELLGQLRQDGRMEVLEAGCGAGRFTEILLQLPAASVTSTDLSSAVEANQINFSQTDRHRIIQCDINQLPFEPEQYDVVLCLGVVQHTKDSETTISDLYEHVKPGGWLVIDHYAHSFSHYTRFGDWLLRPILKRLSPEKGLIATKNLTRWIFPFHRAVRNVRPLQMMLSRFSPLLTYYHALPELGDRLQYEWAELDTHDSLTDTYKHLRSPGSIRRTLEALGAGSVWVSKGGNGIEARCRKPD